MDKALWPKPQLRSRNSVEELNVQIDRLNAERQRLRAEHAGREALEGNRLEIARAQWDLSYALIDRFRPAA